MKAQYEMERFFLIASFVLIGFIFLINVIIIDMYRALQIRDMVMWSNLYFELVVTITVLNLTFFYFYNSLVRQVKI
jgi:hypothetical protein